MRTLGYSCFFVACMASAAALAQPVSIDPGALNAVAGLIAAHAWLVWPVLVLWLAAPLAALLPKAAPGSPWAPIRGVLDALAFNVGNAANDILASPLLGTAVFTAEHLVASVIAAQKTSAPADSGAVAVVAAVAPAPADSGAPVPSVVTTIGGPAVLLLFGLGLAGCSANHATLSQPNQLALQTLAATAVANNTTAADLLAKGMTVCRVAGPVAAAEPIFIGLISSLTKLPLNVVNKAAQDVADACNFVGGIPAPAPADITKVVVQAVPVS